MSDTFAMSNLGAVVTATEAVGLETPSCKSFSSNPLPSATEEILKPSPETLQAADQFWSGGFWVVDNSNWKAALLAMADDRYPLHLKLSTKVNACELLPVAVVVKAVSKRAIQGLAWKHYIRSGGKKEDGKDDVPDRQCQVFLEFLDTFYTATDVAIDKERLERVAANPSLCVTSFIGHLDQATIVKQLRFFDVGLAIGSAADAEAVSALCPPLLPAILRVSVTARVAVEDLRVLPYGPSYFLYFPFLSDDRVGLVRPAIEALLPKLRLTLFSLPHCQLTSHGFDDLTEQLRGVMVGRRVVIEGSGISQPTREEKDRITGALRDSVGRCQVQWGDTDIRFP